MMATLEKRVQVLFHPEQYERLAAEARSERTSVGALIRESVDRRLSQKRADVRAAIEELWAFADAHPSGPVHWEEEKALIEREMLRHDA